MVLKVDLIAKFKLSVGSIAQCTVNFFVASSSPLGMIPPLSLKFSTSRRVLPVLRIIGLVDIFLGG